MTARSTDASEAGSTTGGSSSDRSSAGTGSRLGRAAAAAVGGALVAVGLRRRSLGGAATALAGGWLAYRGLRGGDGDARSIPFGDAEADVSQRSITVGESADDLYERWREPDTLDRVVGPFAEVAPSGEDRHRWTVHGPLGRDLSWETRIVEDRPGELLRWESLEGATIPNEGSIRFRPAPGDRGTEVTLSFRFDPPGGPLGDAAVRPLGLVPDALAGKTLHRFKSLAETGEIPTLEANPSARGSGDLL